MEYKIGVVDAGGNVVGRSDVGVQAHGEATAVLDRNVAGVGRKGDTVRVPSPLEHPGDVADLAGATLALVGTSPDGNEIVHVLDHAAGVAEHVAKAVAPFADRLCALEGHSTHIASRFSLIEAALAEIRSLIGGAN